VNKIGKTKKIKLVELSLEIESIIIGERIKGGIFRPCQDTIPSSTIKGALKHYFGIEVPAVGFFEKDTYEFDEFAYSVKDKFLNTAKMPIITTYMKHKEPHKKIKAKAYIPFDKIKGLINQLKGKEFRLGALKNKGFGKTRINDVKVDEYDVKQGILNVKIFEDEIEDFGIKPISSVYGFLFKPDIYSIGGIYKRSFFPGSLVEGPYVLLKEETYYDEQNE